MAEISTEKKLNCPICNGTGYETWPVDKVGKALWDYCYGRTLRNGELVCLSCQGTGILGGKYELHLSSHAVQ